MAGHGFFRFIHVNFLSVNPGLFERNFAVDEEVGHEGGILD